MSPEAIRNNFSSAINRPLCRRRVGGRSLCNVLYIPYHIERFAAQHSTAQIFMFLPVFVYFHQEHNMARTQLI